MVSVFDPKYRIFTFCILYNFVDLPVDISKLVFSWVNVVLRMPFYAKYEMGFLGLNNL